MVALKKKEKSPFILALEAQGIKVSRWRYHPDCPFCGLTDLGKEAPERPTEVHVLNCTSRPLGPQPYEHVSVLDSYGRPTNKTEKRVRPGTYVGQAVQSTIKYGVRVMRKLPTRYPGEEPFWHCSYKLKPATVYNWVWDGKAWVPWFEMSTGFDKNYFARNESLSEEEERWMAAFHRGKKDSLIAKRDNIQDIPLTAEEKKIHSLLEGLRKALGR